MREILFRGKRIDNGKWVEGYYRQTCGCHLIICGEGDDIYGVAVIPDTVGQFTGLTDRNGKRIFEGDIVKGRDLLEQFREEDANHFGIYGYVSHQDGSFVIVGEVITHYRWLDYDLEVIGNIHNNPELLEVGE